MVLNRAVRGALKISLNGREGVVRLMGTDSWHTVILASLKGVALQRSAPSDHPPEGGDRLY